MANEPDPQVIKNIIITTATTILIIHMILSRRLARACRQPSGSLSSDVAGKEGASTQQPNEE
jgi:hypothetical protein